MRPPFKDCASLTWHTSEAVNQISDECRRQMNDTITGHEALNLRTSSRHMSRSVFNAAWDAITQVCTRNNR
jgi:hypothetical protein